MKVTQSCPTLWDPIDYTVHGILQARILEWVAFPFSRGSSKPRDRTQVSYIAGGFFTRWATREALSFQRDMQILWEAHLKELINLFIIYTFINYLPAFYYWARFMKIVVKKKTELVSSLIKLIIVWWRHRNKRKILNHQCCYIKCDQLNLTKICKSKEMF